MLATGRRNLWHFFTPLSATTCALPGCQGSWQCMHVFARKIRSLACIRSKLGGKHSIPLFPVKLMYSMCHMPEMSLSGSEESWLSSSLMTRREGREANSLSGMAAMLLLDRSISSSPVMESKTPAAASIGHWLAMLCSWDLIFSPVCQGACFLFHHHMC